MKIGLCYILLCFLLMPLTQLAIAQRYRNAVFDDVSIQHDLEYGRAETYLGVEKQLKFDFYEPSGDSLQFRPLVITVFGGSFILGSRSWVDMQAWGDSLARRGFVVASIDYRLGYNPASEKSLIRAAYRAGQDVSAAIRYFKAEYATYGIDTSRIYLLGNSAGSIASLIAAFLTDEERPVQTFGDNIRPDLKCKHCTGTDGNHSSEVAGVISQWGGLTNLHFIDRNEDIPVCFIHGQKDGTVPYDVGPAYNIRLLPLLYGSEYMASHMDSLGIYNELHLFKDKKHCFYLESSQLKLKPDEFSQCLSIVLDFIHSVENDYVLAEAPFHSYVLEQPVCFGYKGDFSEFPVSFRILSVVGRQVQSGNYPVVYQDTNQLNPGIYLLELHYPGTDRFFKLIIN